MEKRIVGLLVLLCMMVQGIWAQSVSTKEELIGAIANGTNIQLTADIQLDSYLDINDKTVTIDLNGHKLSRSLTGHNSAGHVIWAHGGSNLTLTSSVAGGSIEGGKANNGGAIHIPHGNTVTATNVIFQNNTAASNSNGGGIWNGGSLNIKGAVTVSGNKKASGVPHNVYLKSGKVINVAGNIAGSNIGVTMETPRGIFTSGYSANASPADVGNLFFADQADMYTLLVKDNESEARIGVKYIERSWNGTQVVDTTKTLTDYYCQRK